MKTPSVRTNTFQKWKGIFSQSFADTQNRFKTVPTKNFFVILPLLKRRINSGRNALRPFSSSDHRNNQLLSHNQFLSHSLYLQEVRKYPYLVRALLLTKRPNITVTSFFARWHSHKKRVLFGHSFIFCYNCYSPLIQCRRSQSLWYFSFAYNKKFSSYDLLNVADNFRKASSEIFCGSPFYIFLNKIDKWWDSVSEKNNPITRMCQVRLSGKKPTTIMLVEIHGITIIPIDPDLETHDYHSRI